MAVLPTGIGPVTGYNIERSLRFNSADSAYLNRTFVGTPNTYTLSMWIKRSTLGTQQMLVGSKAGASTDGAIQFQADNTINVVLANTYFITTTAVYRDPSAWYHIVLSVTASGTAYLYVNNTQVGSVAVGASCWLFNSSNTNAIGRYGSNATLYYNGYMTEVNFIDGQALTPSSFGETDAATGVWKPKKYTGTYGTNGFFLKFADNSGTTSTTLGKDSSGNGNNWTTNNFSVTAGAGNDSLTDVPTPWIAYNTTGDVGGVVRGNYATLNPLKILTNAPTNGNLSLGTTAYCYGQSTFTNPTGKIYVEATVTGGSATSANVFVRPINAVLSVITDVNANNTVYYRGDGGLYLNGSSVLTYTTYAANDVIGVALDNSVSPPTVRFYKNNVAQGSSAYTLPAVTTTGEFCIGAVGNGAGFDFNFGQRPFAYTPPAGFLSLCSTNLPTPTIGATSTTQANKYFDVTLYTGNNSTNVITNSGSMRPDLVWLKIRSAVYSHGIYDAVRGVGYSLSSNSTGAEIIPSPNDSLTSFNSNGFTLGANNNAGAQDINYTVGGTYVGWQWNAGGSNATNTSGTITSTVRANTTAGFSIVTYTGTGANATVGHGLGVAPKMIIVKNRTSATDWCVWNTSVATTYGNSYCLFLQSTSNAGSYPGVFNSTAPTSSVFSIGTSSATNTNTNNYVAYCFAEVAGYSKFGSYTGNASTDGPFCYTGFRPRYVLVKRTDATESWIIVDTARNTSNLTNLLLYPNLSNAEGTGVNDVLDILSNGFKIRGTGSTVNTNTGTYIYMAIAENPFKYSLAR